MFTGFGISYPEYEVVLPQSHAHYTVRSLTVQEEEHMKGSFISSNKASDHLNRCIWKCIVSKPEEVTDYKSFLKNVTVRDRDSLLYGLYHISYDEIRNYLITCPNLECKNNYNVTVPASSTFNFNPYPEEDILTREIKVELPVTQGVSCYLKQPTLFDENEMTKIILSGRNKDISILATYITKFECLGDKEPIVYSDKRDIIDAFLNLTSRDRIEIQKLCLDKFMKYGIDLKMNVTCPKCGESEVVTIDVTEQFFRSIFTT